MSRPFFFGNSQSTSSNSSYLVQFKAGKMTQTGNTVTPIKDKKGLLYLYQTPDDQLIHFCWKDRTTGSVEDDLIIFPDDVEFRKVPQCTTGRVFVLKFKGSTRRLFFWSQEAKADKDDEYVAKINEYLNNPPSRSSVGGGGSGGSDISTEADIRSLLAGSDPNAQQLINLLGNVRGLGNPNQLASLLSGISSGRGGSSGGNYLRGQRSFGLPTEESPRPGGATTGGSPDRSTTASASSSGLDGTRIAQTGVLLSQLQNVIQSFQRNVGGTSQLPQAQPQAQQQQQQQPPPPPQQQQPDVDLAAGLNYDALKPLLDDQAFMAAVTEHLPNTQEAPAPPVAQQFSATVQSPQFQQALSMFSMGLQSGQLGPLIAQFGLPEECVAAATAGNMEAFLKALQEHQKAENQAAGGGGGSTGEKKRDDQEDMALD